MNVPINAVIYLSLAPKSNSSYIAYEHARKDALTTMAEPVPLVIRNAPTTRGRSRWSSTSMGRSRR